MSLILSPLNNVIQSIYNYFEKWLQYFISFVTQVYETVETIVDATYTFLPYLTFRNCIILYTLYLILPKPLKKICEIVFIMYIYSYFT
jgi:hypothetical protein